MTPPLPRIAIVTGTLAEPAARRVADQLHAGNLAEPTIIVLNIQVAALMTADWVARKLELPPQQTFDRVLLTGYCKGDLKPIAEKLNVPVERGPREIQNLPDALSGRKLRRQPHDYQFDQAPCDIEIIAEINHAARLSLDEIITHAQALQHDGADVIDLGCDPQTDRPAWPDVGETVRALRDRDIRVSIDSFHPREVQAACAAGAELVLSVNSTNVDHARHWNTQVVAIPDEPADLPSLDRTINTLAGHNVPFRIDPIIEPIGFGFARSIGRYLDIRKRYPEIPMMMGVGNLTEMTEVDSAGVNMLLVGLCQELRIHSVLTTRVIHWARSAVRELDIARRIVRFALDRHMPPKHIDPRLVMLRDPEVSPLREDDLAQLAARLKDRNFRIFTDIDRQRIHIMNKDIHTQGEDPFALFEQLDIDDPSHAFYLGYELAKALTAITLAKQYTQDEPLQWGFLTRGEVSHHENRLRKRKREHGPHDQKPPAK